MAQPEFDVNPLEQQEEFYLVHYGWWRNPRSMIVLQEEPFPEMPTQDEAEAAARVPYEQMDVLLAERVDPDDDDCYEEVAGLAHRIERIVAQWQRSRPIGVDDLNDYGRRLYEEYSTQLLRTMTERQAVLTCHELSERIPSMVAAVKRHVGW